MLMGPCVLTLCQQLEVAGATQHSISTILPLMPEAQGLQGEQDSPWTGSIDRSHSREEKLELGKMLLGSTLRLQQCRSITLLRASLVLTFYRQFPKQGPAISGLYFSCNF